MQLTQDEVKRIVAAISKQKQAADLTMLVGSASNSEVKRYFFCVMKGGGSWSMLGAKAALGWLGNAAQGAAGAGLDVTKGASQKMGAGAANIAGAAGKGDALKGLSGAFGAGVLANAKSTSDEKVNNSLMHQLKPNGGLQMIGFMDCSGDFTMKLWYDDLNWWAWYLDLLDSGKVSTEIGYRATCSIIRGKSVIDVGGQKLAY